MDEETKRLKAQIAELEERQKIQRASLESQKDIIVLTIDKEYRYLLFNETHKAVMLHAYGTQISLGMNLLDQITSEGDRKKAKQNYDLALAGTPHTTVEEYGSIAVSYYETRYSPIRDESNEIIGVCAFAQDVTGRVRLEEELRQSEERFQQLFNKAPLGYQSLDFDGNFIEVNQQWLDILGYEREEVIGHWFGDFLTPPYKDGFRKRFPLFKEQGHIHSEFEMRHKDGGSLFIGFDGKIGYTNTGEFKQTHCILQDITERHLMEEEIRRSRNQMQDILEGTNAGTWVWNLLTGEQSVNARWAEIIGYSLDELSPISGETWKNHTHPEDYENANKQISNVFEKKIDSYNVEFRMKHKNGSWVWINSIGKVSSWTPEGKPLIASGIHLDITQRKKAEEKILYIGYHDQLTGLYNRRFYEEELKRLDVPRSLPLTLVIGDINGLKLINDSFGHNKGDEIIRKAAEMLRKGFRESDIVARIGGDEFGIVLPNTSTEEAEQIVRRVKELIAEVNAAPLELSLSFGHETKTESNEDVEEVEKGAEDHMYRHKLYESLSMRSQTIDIIMNALVEKSHRELMHSRRVSGLCATFAKKLGMPNTEINKMRMAGLIHDIGKIGVDEKTLNKPQRLDMDEWEEVKKHPEAGWRILTSVNEFSELANFVFEHHEKWDGTGYPRGLKENEISMEARIIALADAYDAMTNQRTYREAYNKEEAIAELERCAGTQFDPELTRLFVEAIAREE